MFFLNNIMRKLKDIYLDHAATTPLDPRALKEMLPFFSEKFGNASSLHSLGREAREAIERGVSPKLEQSTLDRRKRAGTGGSKPLFETGALHRSIKGTSEGLEMNTYGLYHHRGHETGHFPARPFIQPSERTILKSFPV